jgi:hypothetical protein
MLISEFDLGHYYTQKSMPALKHSLCITNERHMDSILHHCTGKTNSVPFLLLKGTQQ